LRATSSTFSTNATNSLLATSSTYSIFATSASFANSTLFCNNSINTSNIVVGTSGNMNNYLLFTTGIGIGTRTICSTTSLFYNNATRLLQNNGSFTAKDIANGFNVEVSAVNEGITNLNSDAIVAAKCQSTSSTPKFDLVSALITNSMYLSPTDKVMDDNTSTRVK